LGFADCEYLTDCTFTNEWQREDGGFGIAFSSCDHLNNCTVYSNWAGFGFSHCNYVNNCSYINHCEDACDFSDFGFSSCNYVRNCIYDVTQTTGSDFSGCYSDNKKTPCSNTVEGGFNFSNNDEDIVSLKTNLTQEITDRKNADSNLETLIKNKADSSHNHDDRYYTESEIDTKLSNKVDKVSGKGLSTNDYTTTEKNKLAGISTGANKTVVDSALSSTSTNPVQNKVINSALSTYSKLQLINLWGGISSTSAVTLTMSKNMTDFKFILVEACMYSNPLAQRVYSLIPASQVLVQTTTEDKDNFLFIGSLSDETRRLRFYFPTAATLYKLASNGASGHQPVITNVWGIL
jgi:hypothetical protein